MSIVARSNSDHYKSLCSKIVGFNREKMIIAGVSDASNKHLFVSIANGNKGRTLIANCDFSVNDIIMQETALLEFDMTWWNSNASRELSCIQLFDYEVFGLYALLACKFEDMTSMFPRSTDNATVQYQAS